MRIMRHPQRCGPEPGSIFKNFKPSTFIIITALLLLVTSNVSFAQKKVIGYLPTWANFPNIVNTLELNKLTHLNIAFANPNSSGILTGPSNSSVTTVVNAAHAKGVKVFISIGGAGANGAAYQAQLNNTTSMNNFVNNLVQYTVNLNLDGIDVDIEGDVLNGSTVNATQYQNFIVKLGTELRARNKQMTSALAGWFAQHVTNTAAAQFDWINIMSYDAAGSWSGPGQHSPYSLAVNDFNFWKNSKGVPAAKLVIGVPFYGYGWGTYGSNGSGQYIAYSTIVDNHGGSINSDQVGSGNNVIYYNGIPTIKSKANYALQQNAGGIMIWELSQDLTGTRSLLNAIYEVFGPTNPIPQGPFNGVRTTLPGKLEAENYDVGGQTVAYNDLTAGNEGNTFRTDDVDIQATTDAGAGNNIGWLSDGEWLEYSVTVSNTASYSVEFRTASTTGGAIRMELDGADVTGTVALPNTGAWQTWATTTKTNVTLSSGQHLIRLFAVTGGFNLNYINVIAPPNQLPTVTITAPLANTTYTAPATISIAANASDADGSIAKVEFYNGATKLGEDLTSPYTFSWGNVSAGTYNLTARATDNNNAVVTSGAVSVTVNPNQLPTVAITAPLANSTYTAPATISIAANASDADGSIAKVEFYNGATKLGEDLTLPYTFSWSNVAAGTYSITARATDNSNAVTISVAVSISVIVQQSPYNGIVASIPGTMQAENYDLGGQGVAYNDIEIANQGAAYRTDGVDIEATTDAGAGYNVGWTADGEWLEYTVNVASTGNYDAAIRTAGTAASALRIEIDGVDKTGTIALPNTTGWQTWATTTKTNIALAAGQHILRVFVVTGGFNLNSIVFTPTPNPQTPYNNVMVSIPGKIEAENYDLGGQGIAYSDSETANQGTSYRTDGVDLEATTDVGAGYNVGWTTDGEWLEYTVTVATAGAYDLAFRTASTGGGAIRMEVDGADISGTVTLPNTGGWQTWATTNKTNVTLSTGQHVVRLFMVTGGFNLNHVTITSHITGPGFLHASGKNIVNSQGNYILRTANIGNMMVQEGYMLNLGGGYQHNIMQKIADVVGVANKDKFYNDYRNNYLTKADIDSLAKWGFNSIRLPMHYNLFTPLGQPTVFYESGFAKVDEIIGWCKANNMYVILDLHAAPGGQSSGDISDYVAGQPSLWESAANRAQTVALWRKFAERYVNEQYVGGYDLINETNWTLPGNTLLAQLMKDITASIRQVDQNHLLFIEGNSYANDYTGLTPKWDNNMAYSFHKYWNDVNDASVNWVLALRDAQNVPIWLGEYGENSNHWIAETVTLMNKHNIGWAIWPYKKMSSISCIGSFKEPANWSAMAGYINGGAAPSAATAQAILNELAENVKISKTTVNYGYLYALFGASNNTTRAYESISLPGKLSAAKYDEGKNGQAYSDVVYQTAQFGSGGGSFVAWNTGYASRNDGVDLQFSASENANTVGWTENNEWMHYTVNVSTTGSYVVKARVAGNGGTISLASDGVTILNAVSLAATGGWDTWQTVTLGNISLSAGTHKLRVTINTAGYNLNFLEFTTNALANQAPENLSLPNLCNGVTQYVENGGYIAGSRVQNAGGLYECKPNPYSGWCNGAAWAYGPGTGTYWSDAWTKVSNCSARVGETETLSSAYMVTSLNSAPNPFTNITKVEVSLAQSGEVSLEVYDNTGILIKVLYKGYLDSGSYSYEFDSGNLKSDLYLVKLNSNQQVFTQKIVKVQ